MNNQIALEALEALLKSKELEASEQATNIYRPMRQAKTEVVLAWFKENVSPLIEHITLGTDQIEIHRSESKNSWGGLTIYREFRWKDIKAHTKMNWYGGSAKDDETHTLNDVQVFGAVAANIRLIGEQMENDWHPYMRDLASNESKIHDEISRIKSGIAEIHANMRLNKLDSYKQVGYEMQFSPTLDIENEQIIERRTRLKLFLSRGKSHYASVVAYRVIKRNNYHTWVEVTTANIYADGYPETKHEYQVTNLNFDNFVKTVYNWETEECARIADFTRKRFERYYKKPAEA